MKKLIDQYTIQKSEVIWPLFWICCPGFNGSLSCVARKVLMQSDSQQYKGMSRELQENREKNGEELYRWITPWWHADLSVRANTLMMC